MASIALACGSSFTGGNTPTEAYKQYYAAVKSKNTDAIKAHMSEKTLAFAAMAAQRQNQPIEKTLENGLTRTTFAETLPEIRDERVNGDSGSVEVWNGKDNIWEDLPFVKEGGVWKFAMGDLFGGSFTPPGKGQAIREREAANSMTNTAVPAPANVNTVSVANDDPTDAKPVLGNKNK